MIHRLPALPYEFDALEPHIDARTMFLHHDRHHAAYVEALNVALISAPEAIREKTAEWLLLNPKKLPDNLQTAIANNVGGHINHSLFWRTMVPGGSAPTDFLADAIDHAFGSLDRFKLAFEEAGSKLFGSGWVWLAKAQLGDDTLQILTTAGHDNPLAQGFVPLLVNDVWEHAYYRKHDNRRADYLKGWWSVVNWNAVAERFSAEPVAVREVSGALVARSG